MKQPGLKAGAVTMKKVYLVLFMAIILAAFASLSSARDNSQSSQSSTVGSLLAEAKSLKEQSEKLYDLAEKLEKESKDLQESAEELEEDAEDLEDRARALLREADRMEEAINLSRRAYKRLENTAGKKDRDTGTTSSSYLEEQKKLLVKMRSNADDLLVKAKKIALNIRKMAELSDRKKTMADDLNDNADTLEIKSKELKDTADSLEDSR